jgi:hypothetical protein
MKSYLEKLCAQNPDGIMVAVVFRSGLVQGALRKAKDQDGLYELLGPGQVQDPQNPKIPKNVLVSNIFESEAVERVLLFIDIPQPQIVTPGGGIIVAS